MSLFTIDHELCLQDGHCVDECPRYLIEMKDEDAYPTPVLDADVQCIDCGHCMAVCPTGAFTLETMSPDDCADTDAGLMPTGAQFEQLLRSRRSIRTYEGKLVPRDVLEKLIDVARYAPSSSNGQPVEWIVLENPTDVRHLGKVCLDWMREHKHTRLLKYESTIDVATARGSDLVCRNAPHVIIAHTEQGKLTEADGVIALAQLELAAYAQGLAACWSGFADRAIANLPDIRTWLGIPEGRVCNGVMMVGYPQYRYHRMPKRNAARVVWNLGKS